MRFWKKYFSKNIFHVKKFYKDTEDEEEYEENLRCSFYDLCSYTARNIRMK